MKNKLIALLGFLALLILNLNLSAQTPPTPTTPPVPSILMPETLPVSSLTALKAYALNEIRRGCANYEFKHGVKSSEFYSFDGKSVEEVMRLINRKVIRFDTTDPNDEAVTIWSSLSDAGGYNLFEGTAVCPVVVDKDGNASFSPEIELRLVEWFPLDVGLETSSLTIRAQNGDYYTHVFSNKVYDGRAWIPTRLVGKSYEFILEDRFGNKALYQNGRRIPTKSVTGAGDGFRINQFHQISLGADSAETEFALDLEMVDKPSAPVLKVSTSRYGSTFNLDTSLKLADGSMVKPAKLMWFMVGFESKLNTVTVSADGKFHASLPYPGQYFVWPVYEQLENPPYQETPGKG